MNKCCITTHLYFLHGLQKNSEKCIIFKSKIIPYFCIFLSKFKYSLLHKTDIPVFRNICSKISTKLTLDSELLKMVLFSYYEYHFARKIVYELKVPPNLYFDW